jgi:hypothetical protein
MTDTPVNAEMISEQTGSSADEVMEIGCISKMTHGAQFGWRIEPGINPYRI